MNNLSTYAPDPAKTLVSEAKGPPPQVPSVKPVHEGIGSQYSRISEPDLATTSCRGGLLIHQDVAPVNAIFTNYPQYFYANPKLRWSNDLRNESFFAHKSGNPSGRPIYRMSGRWRHNILSDGSQPCQEGLLMQGKSGKNVAYPSPEAWGVVPRSHWPQDLMDLDSRTAYPIIRIY